MEISDESDNDWRTPTKDSARGHYPSPLFDRKWRRIVLDEGRVCRNPKTRLFEAFKAIQAEHVWSVTGTPIVNSTRDLQALILFLRVSPIDDTKTWNNLIDRRIKKGKHAGLRLLQALFRSHNLRRTKGMEGANGKPLVPLPKIFYARHHVDLDPETQEYYLEVETATKEVILNWISLDTLRGSRGHVLVFLSWLRQLACHHMVPRSFLDDVKLKMFGAAQSIAGSKQELSEEDVKQLEEHLVALIEGNEECPFDGSMSVERRNASLVAFSRPNPPTQNRPASSLLAQLENAEARKQAKAAAKSKLSSKLGKHAERDGLYEASRVILLSMGSGALGLNLVQASQVFLMMIARGTVEERFLEIQKRKEELIKDAGLADLIALFGLEKYDVAAAAASDIIY
ncbi:unnamed protein product [Tilletia laevis]|nr:unnamed protein product [Tilletia laevis]